MSALSDHTVVGCQLKATTVEDRRFALMGIAVGRPSVDGYREIAPGDIAVRQARTPAARLGFWSGIAAAISSVVFTVGAGLGIFGVLGHPWDSAAALVPSIILAPSLVALFVSVHHSVAPERRVWSHAAVAFACIYAPLCTVAYVVELSVVQPHVRQGQAEQVALLTLAQYGTQPNTVFSAFDGLGYTFLSLACLFAAPIFGGSGLERWIRWMLDGTGVMGVPTILTYFVNPAFLWLTIPWSITVPAFSVLLAIYFKRLSPSAQLEVLP